MPTVFMKGSVASVAGKRKRMPGANHSNKPEVKAFDPFHNGYEPGVYESVDFIGNTRVPNAQVQNFNGSNFPTILLHPIQGEEANERIGAKYFLKYLKFKGYIYVRRNNPWTIHWRLVLIRLHNIPLNGLKDVYYTYYQNADVTTPANLTTPDGIMSHARHNFYKKMTDPENNTNFRRKVIASGVIPSTYDHHVSNQVAISQGAGLTKSAVMTTIEITKNTALWMPINVTVNCNDNVDANADDYCIVLENDVGMGFDTTSAWTIDPTKATQPVMPDCRNDTNVDYRVFGANFYCKAYFTDT